MRVALVRPFDQGVGKGITSLPRRTYGAYQALDRASKVPNSLGHRRDLPRQRRLTRGRSRITWPISSPMWRTIWAVAHHEAVRKGAATLYPCFGRVGYPTQVSAAVEAWVSSSPVAVEAQSRADPIGGTSYLDWVSVLEGFAAV